MKRKQTYPFLLVSLILVSSSTAYAEEISITGSRRYRERQSQEESHQETISFQREINNGIEQKYEVNIDVSGEGGESNIIEKEKSEINITDDRGTKTETREVERQNGVIIKDETIQFETPNTPPDEINRDVILPSPTAQPEATSNDMLILGNENQIEENQGKIDIQIDSSALPQINFDDSDSLAKDKSFVESWQEKINHFTTMVLEKVKKLFM